MSDEQKNDEQKKNKLLTPFAGALLVAAASFALASIVGRRVMYKELTGHATAGI